MKRQGIIIIALSVALILFSIGFIRDYNRAVRERQAKEKQVLVQRDELVTVTLIRIQQRSETTNFGAFYETTEGERFFSTQVYGTPGETVKIRATTLNFNPRNK